MSLISYKRGQGSVILRVKILDSSVTTGAGKTGLAFNTSGLIIGTIADNESSTTRYRASSSEIEDITTLGTFAAPTAGKCRFKEVDATNHPGVYEIHLADARYAVSSAKSILVSISGGSNVAETDVCIPLTDLDPYDVKRAGLTALPNVAQGNSGQLALGDASGNPTIAATASGAITSSSFASGAINAAAIATDAIGAAELAADAVSEIQSGLATSSALSNVQSDTDDIQTRLPSALVGGKMDSHINDIAANAITAASIATDAIGAAELASDAVSEIQSGLATSSALATVQSDTDDIQTRLPAALVSGRMDASVGAMAANVLTAAAIATDAITAAKIAADAIGASELAADAVSEIQTSLALASALALVQADTDDIQSRLPAALVGGRMDASVGAMASAVLTAAAIATDAITAAKIAADAIGASELASDAVTEIQTSLATAAAVTSVLSRLPAALISGKMDSHLDTTEQDALLTRTIGEDYAAKNSEHSLAEITYMLRSYLFEKAYVGLTLTTKKIDQTSDAMTFTTDDHDDPTTETRTS